VVLAQQADISYALQCNRGYDSGYREYREALGRAASAFGKPVLLIHGDSHVFMHDRPIAAAPNLVRLIVPGARETRAVRVTVELDHPETFNFSLIGPDERVMTDRC
jgi:hypothetical protein